MYRLIAAIDRKRGIAKHGYMPWLISEDERYFTDQTKSLGGQVLSGGVTFRETYHGRPLVNRQNFILTRDPTPIIGVEVVTDLATFLEQHKNEEVWVAGGAAVFEQVMSLGHADVLHLTLIDADFGCDQFFPEYDNYVLEEQSEPREQNGFHFVYARYLKKP